MKSSDLSPKNYYSNKQMLSPRDNLSFNISQQLISSPTRKAKGTTSKLSPTSARGSSSTSFSNNSSGNSSTFNSRESQQSCNKSIQFENDHIQVYLRMRPPLPNEKTFPYEIDNKTITLQARNAFLSSQGIEKAFSFKQIMDHNTTQIEVFEKVALPLIPDFLAGDDVLIFCYGSTNAGKTFTVSGTNQNPGILRRSLECIVTKLYYESDEENESENVEKNGKVSHTKAPQLFASFVEIYNERIYDLLNIQKNAESLKLGVNSEGETEIKGTYEIPINSIEDVKTVVQKAEAGRHRGFTELNCDSSRSHTVFQLKIRRKNLHSTFSIVDLAGSERLSSINSTKGSFKEACNINKSMLALGKCIRYLKFNCQSPAKCRQIPYRESKLTHIFKNFFEPTLRPSKAAMIINVSPSLSQIDDTVFAMQFAASASLCSIKHVERQEVESYESEEEEPEVINPPEPKETIEEIEARIEKKLREEMDEYFAKLEKEFKDHYNKVNNLNQTILNTRNEITNKQLELSRKQHEESLKNHQQENDKTKPKTARPKKIKKKVKVIKSEKNADFAQLLKDKDRISELQKILNSLTQQNMQLQNENDDLLKQINESKEKLNDSDLINKKITEKNKEMKNVIEKIEAKSDEYSQTILYETQSVVQRPFTKYPIQPIVHLPPAITFSNSHADDKDEKRDLNNNNNQKPESNNQNSDPSYHPVRRVLIPPPK